MSEQESQTREGFDWVEGQEPEGEASERKRDLRIVLIWAILVMALLVIGVLYLLLRKTRIPLNDYLQIETEGIDSIGTATYRFDAEGFVQDYKEIIRYRGGKANTTVDTYPNAAEALLYTCVDGGLNKEEDLSNGETITFMWTCNEEIAAEDFHCVLVYSNLEKVVDNLTEAETFDPFSGVTVDFAGTAPNGTASVRLLSEEELFRSLRYTLDKTSGLSNGDKVKLTVSAEGGDVEEATLHAFGKVPTTLEKEITVQGLTTYATALSDLSDMALQELRSKAEEVFQAQEVPSWRSGATLLNREYLGAYFLTPIASGTTTQESDLPAGVVEDLISSLLPEGTGTVERILSDRAQAPIDLPFGWGNTGDEEEEEGGSGFQWSDLLNPSFYGFGSGGSNDGDSNNGSDSSNGSDSNNGPGSGTHGNNGGWGNNFSTPTPTPEPEEDWFGLEDLFHTAEYEDDRQNILYLVYRVEVSLRGSTSFGGSSTYSYYTYTAFSDIQVAADGTTTVDLEAYHVPTGSSVLGVTSGDVVSVRQGLRTYYFSGFDTLNQLYLRTVYEHRDDYACESSVEE